MRRRRLTNRMVKALIKVKMTPRKQAFQNLLKKPTSLKYLKNSRKAIMMLSMKWIIITSKSPRSSTTGKRWCSVNQVKKHLTKRRMKMSKFKSSRKKRRRKRVKNLVLKRMAARRKMRTKVARKKTKMKKRRKKKITGEKTVMKMRQSLMNRKNLRWSFSRSS